MFGFELFSPRSIVHVYSQDSQEGCEITFYTVLVLFIFTQVDSWNGNIRKSKRSMENIFSEKQVTEGRDTL